VEWNESNDEFEKRCKRLGKSILGPLKESIKNVEEGHRLYEEARIRVRDLKIVADFQEYLNRLGIDTIFEEPQFVGGEYLITIKKLNKSTTDKTQAIWQGELW
jgi:putative ATP-dependent DNA ligase